MRTAKRSTLPFLLPAVVAALGLVACGDASDGLSDSETDTLLEDASFEAALSAGDGEALETVPVTFGAEDAAAEEVDLALLGADGEGEEDTDCRLAGFRHRVFDHYDVNDDGFLGPRERLALAEDFGPRPVRRMRHARHHRRLRLHWIYDADGSGRLEENEREELRLDLETRCLNRQAQLLENFDLDDSGDLDADERAAVRAALRERLEARRDALLDTFDVDDSGRLEIDERIAAYFAHRLAIAERRVALRDAFDVDDSGDLDDEELAALREFLKDRVRGEHFGEDGEAEGEG